MGNLQVRLCDQERLARSVGYKPTEVKVRSLVAWIAGRREIEFPKPIDKAIFRMVSKSSGRNESERRCGLESEKTQGLSFQPEGESSMDRRRLTDAAVSLWRGRSDSTMARTRQATGETLLVPTRNRRSRKSYNRKHREIDGRREGVGGVHSIDEAG
jgi:hypothetical protein